MNVREQLEEAKAHCRKQCLYCMGRAAKLRRVRLWLPLAVFGFESASTFAGLMQRHWPAAIIQFGVGSALTLAVWLNLHGSVKGYDSWAKIWGLQEMLTEEMLNDLKKLGQ